MPINQLDELAAKMQARLLQQGAPASMEAVLRDARASLYRWHEAGEHVYRIREAKSDLSPELI
jgi:hypothetical protein